MHHDSSFLFTRRVASMLAPLYMAEISPPEVRGSLMALEQFSIVLGVVLGFWTGFLTRNCKLIFFDEVGMISVFLYSRGFLFVADSARLATHSWNCTRHRMLLFTTLTSSLGPSRKVSRSSREFGKVASHKC